MDSHGAFLRKMTALVFGLLFHLILIRETKQYYTGTLFL